MKLYVLCMLIVCQILPSSACSGEMYKTALTEEQETSLENTLFVAPDGVATNTGTQSSPLDLYSAISKINIGGTIYVKGGVYKLTKDVNLDKKGREDAPYKLWAYENEKPVFDFIEQVGTSGHNTGIRFNNGTWWHVKGLEVCNSYSAGFRILNGSHITIENCSSHHNGGPGFHIGYPHGEAINLDGEKAAYNTFLNCDSYNNFDWRTMSNGRPRAGTNADGFSCQSSTGKGNRYIGCRAWSNSDDGWDFYECGYALQLINCWVWSTGVMEDHKAMYLMRTGKELTADAWDGNGNGFKIGGGHLFNASVASEQESKGIHVIRGCISFNNKMFGFDSNHHRYGAIMENCLAFNNNGNISYRHANVEGYSYVLRNNISFNGKNKDRFENITISVNEGNTWNQPNITTNPITEFISLSVEDAKAPRGINGELPTKFGRLTPNSKYINAGVATLEINNSRDEIHLPAIPYLGTAPDLGAFEKK